MKLKFLLTLFVFCSVLFSVAAQKTVTGTITSETNEPIIGASIVEKGTTKGTISDIDGKFSIQVSDDATLIVSFVGYSTQEIVVGSQANLEIRLVESALRLDDAHRNASCNHGSRWIYVHACQRVGTQRVLRARTMDAAHENVSKKLRFL
jgi:hypothetical protein